MVKQEVNICLAGKNDVACESLYFLLESNLVKRENICVLPVNGKEDFTFMKSLRGCASDGGIRLIYDQEELYGVPSLLFFSLEYNKLLKTDKYASSELFNIHFSLLPAYKGLYTSAWPILNGERVTGVTLHKIDKGIDTGGIIDQIEFPINIDDTSRDLYINYNKYGVEIFKRNLASILKRRYKVMPQSFHRASYYSKNSLDFKNPKVNLYKTAFEIHNQVRAYVFPEYQLPMIHGRYIIKSEISEDISIRKPGTIIMEDEKMFIISTIDYNVKLYKEA